MKIRFFFCLCLLSILSTGLYVLAAGFPCHISCNRGTTTVQAGSAMECIEAANAWCNTVETGETPASGSGSHGPEQGATPEF